MEEQLTEILEMLKNGILLTKEQLPLIIQELLFWKRIEFSMGGVFGIFLLTLSYILYKKARKKVINIHDYWEDILSTLAIMGTVAAFIIGVTFTAVYIPLIIKITFAPKIWLIDYISSIVK